MITLITGTPGAGKTLRVVELLVEIRNSDDPKTRSRLVFTNINGLDESLSCLPFDESRSPLQWAELPEGSLLVVDECQDFWPARPAGSKRPESVASMNTHRHKGIDFLLVTQHPGLIDHDIRALVGRHLHGYRPRSLEHSVWSEWSYCEMACQPKLKPVKEKKVFNRELFGLYKSTVENTHKPQSWWPVIKKALPFLMLLPLGVSGLVYGFSNMAGDKQQSPVSPVKTAAPIYEESPPGAPATGEGGPASVPVPPAAAPTLPVLEYHGWTSYGGRPEFLLCQPAAPAAQSGLGSPDEGPTGPGCAVELHWSDVAHYRLVGSRIIVQAGPNGPDLWQIADPGFVLDLTRAGHRLANR